MILKKILGKTVDEAREEARRLYGEHVVVLETVAGDGKKQPASVTVMVDQPTRERTVSDATPPANFRNVFYKRSDVARVRRPGQGSPTEQGSPTGQGFPAGHEMQVRPGNATHSNPQSGATATPPQGAPRVTPPKTGRFAQPLQAESFPQKAATPAAMVPETQMPTRFEPRAQGTSRLDALRRYASETDTLQKRSLLDHKPVSQRFELPPAPVRNTGTMPQPGMPASNHSATPSSTTEEPALAEPKGTGSALQNIRSSALQGLDDSPKREIAALHKRFDRLESLLDNNVAAADIDLVAHPAFQQLIGSGIRPALVSRWFSGIIRRGIDPADQPERFMSELSSVVRYALEKQSDKAASPIQVFVGPAGAGKTNLVMQLALYARTHGKKVAIVAVIPAEGRYYSGLELFCAGEEIPYIRSGAEQGILDMQEQMQDVDMVLIDTPSLPMSKEAAWRAVWSLRQRWSVPGVKADPDTGIAEDIPPLPAEINYVFNAATGPSALNYLTSLHHTLEPDVVSFTHLDELDTWGALIPVLDDMHAPCRYLCTGITDENGIRPYDAGEVARNILNER